MKKYLIFILLILSVGLQAKLKLNGRFFQNLLISEKLDQYTYSDFNILYLKLKQKSYNYTFDAMTSIHYYLYPNPVNSDETVSQISYNLDRMYLSFWGQSFKIKLGYFMPKWGKNYFFRPTDLFESEQVFNAAIEQKGIKGFEFKYFFTDFLSSELLLVPQANPTSSAIYFKNNLHIGKFNLSGFYNYYAEQPFSQLGLNFKGDLGISLFGEGLYTLSQTNDYKFSLGADYSFAGKVMFILEYYYHDLGLQYSDSLSYQTKLLSSNFSSFFAQQYLFVNMFYFSDKQIGVNSIINLVDYSSIQSLYYTQEIFNACTLYLGIYFPFSKNKNQEFNYNLIGDILFNSYINIKF